jgi:hypothetical protein
VTVTLIRRPGALTRAVLLGLGVALIPWPAAAADSVVPPKPRTLQASMARIVARESGTARPAAVRAARQGSAQGSQSPGFFRTRAGAVIAAVMIAGTGYALYSTRHDRVHSPGKQ